MEILPATLDIKTLQSITPFIFLAALILGIIEFIIHNYYRQIRNKGERGMRLGLEKHSYLTSLFCKQQVPNTPVLHQKAINSPCFSNKLKALSMIPKNIFANRN